jgi:hypothetical protein
MSKNPVGSTAQRQQTSRCRLASNRGVWLWIFCPPNDSHLGNSHSWFLDVQRAIVL